MRKDTWEIVSRKSVADQNVLPGTWSFKCKRKPDRKIRKFKAQYFVRGDFKKRLYNNNKPLNLYYTVVKWDTVRLMLIYQFILGSQSQSVEFTNSFSQVDILSGEPVFIELPRDFKSDGGQGDGIDEGLSPV